MKDTCKSFLNAWNHLSDSIKIWTDSLRMSCQYKNKLQPIPFYIKSMCFILFMVLLFSACGERTPDQQRSADMETMGTDGTSIDEREQPNTIPGVGTLRVVEMEAKDHVYFPREITAHPGEQFYVNLINGGNEAHNIHIELPQAPLTFGDPVPMGQTRKLLVMAPTEPGRYQIFCPIKDHRQRGMIATLIVE